MNKVTNMYQTDAQILGIPVTGTKRVYLLTDIKKKMMKLDSSKAANTPLLITTPNPEHLLMAQKDVRFANILRTSSYSLPDGYGLAVATKYLQMKLPKNIFLRIPVALFQGLWVGVNAVFRKKWIEKELKTIKGREFFMDLVYLANTRRWRVFLLGGEEGVAQKAADILLHQFKKAKFEFHTGPVLDNEAEPASSDISNRVLEKDVINKINEFKPHFLFVGFGAPKQEKWLERNLKDLNVGTAMVVGGTFDYIAGTAKLPPKFLAVNSEWLWRLITQPKRIKRIANALFVFPLKVYISHIKSA